jgi:hypothetical protein
MIQKLHESARQYEERHTCGRDACYRPPTFFKHQAKIQGLRMLSKFPGHVPLVGGRRALVDPEDFDRVIQFAWNPRRSYTNTSWYAVASVRHEPLQMHHLVMGVGNDALVDHVNRNGLDNRRANLRFATSSQNAMNRKRQSNNTSGFKGVTWNKLTRQWQAMIQVNHKLERIGFFDNPEDAARAYDAAARMRFGEFARLNFPEQGEQAA